MITNPNSDESSLTGEGQLNKQIQLLLSLTKIKFRSIIFTKDNFRRVLWKIRR